MSVSPREYLALLRSDAAMLALTIKPGDRAALPSREPHQQSGTTGL
jgi:hypothetical protein